MPRLLMQVKLALQSDTKRLSHNSLDERLPVGSDVISTYPSSEQVRLTSGGPYSIQDHNTAK